MQDNNSSIKQTYIAKILTLMSHNKEYLLYKYLPTSIMMMLSSYIYSMLRGVKDSVLVPTLGAELISLIKLYGVFPATVIFFVCFSKLANIFARDKLYYIITSFFIGFFLLYAFVLSPYSADIHPDLSEWTLQVPTLKHQVSMLQHWTITIFYIMCEICGTVMLTLLFWQFANDLYTVKEAKNSYALFGLLGQLGLIIAGIVQSNLSVYFDDPTDQLAWALTLKWIMASIALAGIGLIFLYRWMFKNILLNPKLCSREFNTAKEKVSLSLKESFKYVFSSRYLWLIMLIVFCYGLGVNLIESVWKDQIRQQYITSSAYSSFIGKFHIYFGLTTMVIMLFGSYILRKFRWLVPALCTPVGAGISGVVFFMLIIFRELFEPLVNSWEMPMLMMAVLVGSTQVILFKAFNYTFVDSTKEMAFIPLDRELRTKGKAAVDVIGGRFGKSFGAILFQLMFYFVSPNLSDLTIQIFVIFVIAMVIWIFSVIALNKEFTKVTES